MEEGKQAPEKVVGKLMGSTQRPVSSFLNSAKVKQLEKQFTLLLSPSLLLEKEANY